MRSTEPSATSYGSPSTPNSQEDQGLKAEPRSVMGLTNLSTLHPSCDPNRHPTLPLGSDSSEESRRTTQSNRRRTDQGSLN